MENTFQIEAGVKVGPINCGGLYVPIGCVAIDTPDSGYVVVSFEDYKNLGGITGVLARFL